MKHDFPVRQTSDLLKVNRLKAGGIRPGAQNLKVQACRTLRRPLDYNSIKTAPNLPAILTAWSKRRGTAKSGVLTDVLKVYALYTDTSN